MSEWVGKIDLRTKGDKRKILRSPTNEIGNALRAMGPDSIPFLIAWMDPHPTKVGEWILIFEKKQNLIRISPDLDPLERSEQALYAFNTLGQAAEPAIPQLAALIYETNQANCYLAALAGLGPKSKPLILQALRHTNSIIRKQAVRALDWYDEDPGFAVPSLIQLLRDQHTEVRYASAIELVYLKSQPKTIVPALISALSDHETKVCWEAAWALGEFGTNATEALPVLQQLLTQTNLKQDEKLRLDGIIRRITYGPPPPSP